MNKLPPTAAGVLEQARRADREHRIDVERALVALHTSLPVATADLPLPGQAGPSTSATGSLPPAGAVTHVSGKALFGGKAAKLFLATAVAGMIGGGALWGFGTNERTVRSGAGAVSGQGAIAAVPSGAGARVAHTGPDASAVRALSGLAGPGLDEVHADSSAQRGPVRPAALADAASHAAHAAPAGGAIKAAAQLEGSARRAPGRPVRVAPRVAPLLASAQREGAEPAQAAVSARDSADTAGAQPASDMAQAAPVPPQPAAHAVESESELDLIDAALTSLREGQGTRALSLLEIHGARYPTGKFAMERQGLRVLALCALGRVEEGRAARRAFLRAVRDAPIVARVRRACDEEQ
jgi:hypothetical protein